MESLFKDKTLPFYLLQLDETNTVNKGKAILNRKLGINKLKARVGNDNKISHFRALFETNKLKTLQKTQLHRKKRN